MRRRMISPPRVATLVFLGFAHCACFSLSSVGTKKERGRLLLLVSRFSENHVTILCAKTLYSIQRSTPICQLGQRKVFVSLLELVWTLSSESAYCKRFILLPCCFDKQMILWIMLLELSSLQPNKKKKKTWIRDHLNYAFWAPSSTQI
jgi:hypothetical protein